MNILISIYMLGAAERQGYQKEKGPAHRESFHFTLLWHHILFNLSSVSYTLAILEQQMQEGHYG